MGEYNLKRLQGSIPIDTDVNKYFREDLRVMMDWLDEVVVCKYCGNKTTEDEKIWLNGKCMCPQCYMRERAKEDAKRGSSNE